MKKQKQGFTLVELLIVVAILAVLATVGFVSYSNYLTGVRDTNRVTQLVSIRNAIETFKTTKDTPLPEEKIDIEVNGELIAYQGIVGQNILNQIGLSDGGTDPKDETYFPYYLTRDRKYFQLMTFLEDEPDKEEELTFFPQTYASTDYSIRYPKVIGFPLGILTEKETNTPLHEIEALTGTLDVMTASGEYVAHIQDNNMVSGTGSILAGKLYALSKPKLYEAPKDCPNGFIGVPGDPNFDQKGFCVAQYEMTYSDADSPNSTGGGTDWNTRKYESGKTPISMAGKYPIVDITQGQAIEACRRMGEGYHLITNNEWMTIARNIEMEGSNWSSGTAGEGYIPNGVSNDTSLGCNATGGNTESRTYATKTGPGTDTDCNARRSHTLSNGQVIWDLSGNVWEHVNKANTLDGRGYDTGTNPDILSANGRGEWSSASQGDRESYGPLIGVDANNGIGRVYQEDGTVFLRGGDASTTAHTGVFTVHLSRNASSQSRNVGFRCAY